MHQTQGRPRTCVESPQVVKSAPPGTPAATLPGAPGAGFAGGPAGEEHTEGNITVAQVGIRELLEAGVHFGHQTRRWNPKMRRFLFGERGGVYIIDLLKTAALLAQAQQFASELAHRGGSVLFVGTKKQARDTIRAGAEPAGTPPL